MSIRSGGARLWRLALAVLLALAGATAMAPSMALADDGGVPPIVDPSAPFVLGQALFVLVPQGPAVHVEELVDGGNRGTAPVRGLMFPLPPGAVGAAVQSGVTPDQFTVAADGMHIAATVPVGGTVHYAFSYTVSWAGGRLWLPVAYPTGTLTVLVPHGQWAADGSGFRRTGTLPLSGGLSVDRYTTLAPTAGALLPLRLRAAVWWTAWARRSLAVLAAAAVVLGVVRTLRRRRAAAARHETELVDALARLDIAHRRGELEDGSYLDRRQHLLEELQALHGG